MKLHRETAGTTATGGLSLCFLILLLAVVGAYFAMSVTSNVTSSSNSEFTSPETISTSNETVSTVSAVSSGSCGFPCLGFVVVRGEGYNFTGFRIWFHPPCAVSNPPTCSRPSYEAYLNADGLFNESSLGPGMYIAYLSPCPWTDCNQTFPMMVSIDDTPNKTLTIVITNIPDTGILQCNVPLHGINWGVPALYIPIGKTLDFCVRFYYYDPNPESFNLASHISIKGAADSDFTISVFPSKSNNITMGGPNNESEGFLVLYEVTPRPFLDGAFVVNFGLLSYGGYSWEECDQQFVIASGSGIPDYSGKENIGYCWGFTNLATAAVPYPDPPGILVAQILGAANSTS